MIFGRSEHTIVLKKKREVVSDLEKEIYRLLDIAENFIQEGRKYGARKKLGEALYLKKIRGYETKMDKRYDSVFDKYVESFKIKI